MRKRIKSIALCLVLTFGLTTTLTFAGQGGSIGQGNISVLKGGQLVDKLSGQNPIEDESMLVCDGKCMIKSAGISMVADDQAKFAIKNETDTFRLFLREGSVDYVITDKARKIAFHTPEGVYSVAEIIFNAASESVVRGSVMVNKDGKTEISVKEGKLVFATADGMKAVGANEKIVLAISSPPAAAAGSNISPFVVIGTGAAVLATVIVVADNNDDDNPIVTPESGPAPVENPPPGSTPPPTPVPTASPST